MSTQSSSTSASFESLYAELRSLPTPLLPPKTPCDSKNSHRISDLFVHPTLEAALHLLNHDLPSAHFLVRHMQDAPKYEGMYLHGILHRIEGDYNNARAWYGDVSESPVFKSVWGQAGGLEKAREFIQRIQDLKTSPGDHGEREKLEKQSMEEIDGVILFCKDKFGTERYDDVSDAWKQPSGGKVKEIGQEQIMGGKGHRKF